MDLSQALGLKVSEQSPVLLRQNLQLYVNLKLASYGQPTCIKGDSVDFLATADDMLRSFVEKSRQLVSYHYPVDQRIQDFLNSYLSDLDLDTVPSLPTLTFELDRHGIARELSLPAGKDEFHSECVASYKVKQGVLHNPANDRRTTKGSFHIAEGGLPVPGDKKEVPKITFAGMLKHALNPPKELTMLPYTANEEIPAYMFTSLLLRPTVCPAIPGIAEEKSMEIRFFAPGTLVSNLDFVESIFGNGGNPALPEFDAGLDVEHWTGQSGCVILAPHLVKLTKKELGLPHWDEATERQRKDGMCWKNSDELYNDGQAFKLTARDERGVIVTLLADNYFGYCKKEVKTQIGYAANLYGFAEEEHAGGALAFHCSNHGSEYGAGSASKEAGFGFSDMVKNYGELMNIMPEGYAIDKQYPDIVYVPQNVKMDVSTQTISWENDKIIWNKDKKVSTLRLQPGKIYVKPNGYKLELVKHPAAPSWRLIGTASEGTFCHKPSTVSGGGKSEISKSISDAVIYNSLFVNDLTKDLDWVQAIFDKNFSHRFKADIEEINKTPSRTLLSSKRSLGSVIKLLTPSTGYTDEFNDWLYGIPPYIRALVLLIKRFYQTEWGENWRTYFSVDIVDGSPGHNLKFEGRQITASFLRVGFNAQGGWRTFKVRQDFYAAEKIQMEDDITASVVIPSSLVQNRSAVNESRNSVKLVTNCEYRLFQRPDDAVIPGYDKQTELNMAGEGNFIANYEPLIGDKLSAIVEDVQMMSKFTQPMHDLLQSAYQNKTDFVVSSAHPRIVNGAPTKNPRYLEVRADMVKPIRKYLADLGVRLHRKIPLGEKVIHPVDAVLAGRRNNPPEPGIRALAVYNPIHYQHLPELFMDFISSLTGKSPSTTGAGSEGALTKGPFNALRPTADLNNTLVSFILTGYAGFSSSAGHIGSFVRVDHDISLLIPEIWTRLRSHERAPAHLIEQGLMEALEDFEHKGKTVLASRLGYRITEQFVHEFMGKIFDNPSAVLTEDILQPETQNLDDFVDGINNIVETQQKVAQQYLDDGSINDACPPLQALLHIMATGHYQGKDVHDPEIRVLFTKENLLASDWYLERLQVKQTRDIALWQRHVESLQRFSKLENYADEVIRLEIKPRLEKAKIELARVESLDYLDQMVGMIGADPLGQYRNKQV
ncbi:MAG: hypothetical protein KAH20_15615 [Methylococcales bacterium]|nr:hypothetical protein [Methylococcales bacterium]